MEVLINKKNVIFDATLLTGMSCGRFFDLRFNHSLVQNSGPSNSLEAGSIVHKVLEVYNKAIIGGIKRKDAIGQGMTAGQMYIQGCIGCSGKRKQSECSCGHEPDEYPGVQMPVDNEGGYGLGWRWVLETMEQYFDYYKGDTWIPLEAEVVKREIIYEDEQIRILWKAKLDAIMDTTQMILPMDHKTMKQRRDTIDLNNQFMGQAFLQKTNRVVINKIGFQSTLEPKDKFVRSLITYSADRLLEWQSEIVPYYAYRLLEYSESGYYPPDFSKCEGKFGNCVFIEVCRADRHMREQELRINFTETKPWDIGNEGD